MASSLPSGLSSHFGKGLVSLWIMTLSQHLHKVFRFCSGHLMHILHQNTFISGTHNSSPDRCNGCTFVVRLTYNYLNG